MLVGRSAGETVHASARPPPPAGTARRKLIPLAIIIVTDLSNNQEAPT